jgi:thiol-disulfide isomerase/thioredoxin
MKISFFLKNTVVSLLLLTTFLPVFPQKYEIGVSMKSQNDTVVLGHYFAKNNLRIPDDTVILKNGRGIFRGNGKLPAGLYFIYNNQKTFDIIIGDNQKFSIVTDTANFIQHTRFESSPENDVFYDFQRYNLERGKEFAQLGEQWKNATEESEKNAILKKQQALGQERIAYIQKLIDGSPDSFVAKFLKAIVPLNVPDAPAGMSGDEAAMYRYRWYRAHFFDNFDIYDSEMLRTPFYEDKVMEYLTKVVPQYPDTICAELDIMLAKAQPDGEMFRCISVVVFNYYVQSKIMVHENVWVHIAEKWYVPYATWSTDDYIEKLKEEVEKKKPNLTGKPAPPMEMLMALPPEHFKAAALDTAIKFDLYAGVMIEDFRKILKAKYTAILFWDHSCSHCKKMIQDLFRVYEEYGNRGLHVITVQTVISKEAKGKWIDYINEQNMFGWTNAWSPFSNKFREYYDISSTPLLYLLDGDGTIVAKRIGPEQIKDFIDTKQ